MRTHFILYVADQARSASFYSAVLATTPSLNVPGMTEFELGGGAILGLMPEAGIERLCAVSPCSRELGVGGVRGELYFVVEEPEVYHSRALSHGGRELSAFAPRDWGHDV